MCSYVYIYTIIYIYICRRTRSRGLLPRGRCREYPGRDGRGGIVKNYKVLGFLGKKPNKNPKPKQGASPGWTLRFWVFIWKKPNKNPKPERGPARDEHKTNNKNLKT